LSEAEAVYRQLHEHHAPTMRFLTDLGIPLPKAFLTAAEFALNGNLRHTFEKEDLDPDRVQYLFRSARAEGAALDTETLSFAWRKGIEREAERFFANPWDPSLLERLDTAARIVRSAPFEVDLWKVQNGYYRLLEDVLPEQQTIAEQGHDFAKTWVKNFISLGQSLSVRVP
jgi:hypothetical protein